MKLCTNKMNKLEEMGEFLEMYAFQDWVRKK